MNNATNVSHPAEIHSMLLENGVMRMRRVDVLHFATIGGSGTKAATRVELPLRQEAPK